MYASTKSSCVIDKIIKWERLPRYVKKGKFKMEIVVKVDRDSIEYAVPDYSRFITSHDHVFLVNGQRIYVRKEVCFIFS